MKTLKKVVAILLAMVMVIGFAACGAGKKLTDAELHPEVDLATYQQHSTEVYEANLGDFAKAYKAAKAETKNVSLRNALMAIAEAKLLESGTYLPGTSKGGNYAISRVAPYTVSPCLWGIDSDKFHNAVVVKGNPITSEDRTEMKKKYAELKGSGTYEAWVKEYLKGKGYELDDVYGYEYSSDPKTWDILATYRSADTEAICNTVDMLYEYDNENRQVPALALSHTVSADGTVYTFKLREGVVWTDYQGRVIADVCADDFVAGLQHLLDVAGGLEGLAGAAGANIKNADAYLNDEVTFDKVGVKAIDKYTLQYTLESANPFFLTMLSYNPLAPLCRTYYLSQGGVFGDKLDTSAESYMYGKDPNHIAYCGPYLVTSNVKENSIVFEASKSYWNASNINIKKINWMFNDGKDALKAYNDMLQGKASGAGLNASALEKAKEDGNFDKYSYLSSTDATSYGTFVNINRTYYANFDDITKCVTTQRSNDIARTKAALQNQNFRVALMYALDRAAYNAQSVGETLKLVSLINSYTPGDFVQLEEDVKVSINGTETTFTKGTYYGAIMQAQIDADGFKMKVWDPQGNDGLGSSAGFDGWFNPEAANESLDRALEELDMKATKSNPIKLDLPTFTGSPIYLNRANAYKQSVEKVFNGRVVINLVECESSDLWYSAGYYCDYGYQANFDLYDVSGWGPDYGDPQSYLNTFYGAEGDMIHSLGLF